MKFNYTSIPTIPLSFVSDMFGHLSLNDDAFTTLRKSIDRVSSQNAISIECYSALLRDAVDCCDDEMIGLLDKRVPKRSVHMLCKAIVNCCSIADALELYTDFYALFNTGRERLFRITHTCDGLTISISRTPYFPDFLYQLSFLSMLKISCWLGAKRIKPKYLVFPFKPVANQNMFTYLFGNTPVFNGATPKISFYKEDVDCPVTPLYSASEFSEQFVQNILHWRWTMHDLISQRVYADIYSHLASGHFQIQHVAKRLAISPHTLARKLKKQKSSYTEILNEVRREKALTLIADNLSFQAVAEQLGFREYASFTRAFIKWTGLSPKAWQRTHQR